MYPPPPPSTFSAVAPPPRTGPEVLSQPFQSAAISSPTHVAPTPTYPVASTSAFRPYEEMNKSPIQIIPETEVLDLNASTKYLRPTCTKFPHSTQVKQRAHIPIGAIIQPLSPLAEGESEVPVVNLGEIIRCSQCIGYINSFVKWEANGRRWVCNLCMAVNDTPQFYFQPLDNQGKRIDISSRPELYSGSVDFVAPSEYLIRPPQPPCYMFMIEVTQDAVSTGMLSVICSTIKDTIQKELLPSYPRAMIGIMTFDTNIHFYNLSSTSPLPQMLVVSTFSPELYLPLPRNLLVNVSECKENILNLLNKLPDIWNKASARESCLGSAVSAAYLAMRHIGGKLCVFASLLPTVGEHKLRTPKSRQTPKTDTKTESFAFKPEIDGYKTLSHRIVESYISAELFLCTHGTVDLASICPLVRFSSGDIHYYPKFVAQLHGHRLAGDLVHMITRLCGWEALLRIRVSTGWKITQWFGHFWLRRSNTLNVAHCHSDQSFGVMLDLEDGAKQCPMATIQAALLYTSSEGERRVRVHTSCFSLSQNPLDVIASIDIEVVAALLAQQAIRISLTTRLSDGRSHLTNACSEIITPLGKISLNAAQSFALLILGFLKSQALREIPEVSTDQRIYTWSRLESLSLSLMISFMRPRLIPLHHLKSDSLSEIPRLVHESLNLSSSSMVQHGVYLLEDGESIYIWIGSAVPQQWLLAVFGVPSLQQLHPEDVAMQIGASGDPLGLMIRSLISTVCSLRSPPYPRIMVISQGDVNDPIFFSSLIEDRTYSVSLTLPEFINKMAPQFPRQVAG